MRLVSTASVEKGTVLAKAIYTENGRILLNEGYALEERSIARLLDLGIAYIYIDDSETKDIKINSPISQKLRNEAIKTIEATFKEVGKNTNLPTSFVLEKSSKKFTELIRVIMTEIKDNHDLLTILSDVFIYDSYIFSHSFNVTLYSLAIGIELNLNTKELETLGLGAILHDVGKMKIPLNILMKPGKLTYEEYTEIKKHAEEGFQILRKVHTIPLAVAHCAYQHHERNDGSGYPRGLKGNEIHPLAKIIAVADVFDAVTTNRVYRQAMLPHEGLEILYAGTGTMFDHEIIEAFRRAVAIYPVGVTVELNDGRRGVIIRQNAGLSERPVIRILEENQGKVKPYELDLKTELNIVITGCDTKYKKVEK